MNKRLDILIKKPLLANPDDLPWIDEKITDYPYVSTYRLLRLVALKKHDQKAFENELPKVSYFFNDPSFLSNYFEEREEIAPVDLRINPELQSPAAQEKPVPSEVQAVEVKTPDTSDKFAETISQEKSPITKFSLEREDESELIKNLRKLGLEHLIPTSVSAASNLQEKEDSEVSKSEEKSEVITAKETVSDSKEKISAEVDENIPSSSQEEIKESVQAESDASSENPEELSIHSEIPKEEVIPSAQEESYESISEKHKVEEDTEHEKEIVNQDKFIQDVPLEIVNRTPENTEVEEVDQEKEAPHLENLKSDDEKEITESSDIDNKEPEVVDNELVEAKSETPKEIIKEENAVHEAVGLEENSPNPETESEEENALDMPLNFVIEAELEDLALTPIQDKANSTSTNLVSNEVESKSETSEKELNQSEKDKKTFTEWLKLYQKPSIPLSKQSKKSKVDAIDAFIENSPKISPISGDERLVDINSLVENDQTISHLMTETLADLYVEQKKYSKAIEAYQILILKNPEKSSIFADQIEKIKNLK